MRENNLLLNLFLYKKYKDEVINKIELNWCNDDIKIPAPLKRVKIPNVICKKMISPKIIIGLNNDLIFLL